MEDASWIMALATVAMALATVALVCLTYKYVHLTNKILKSHENINEELLRPYVIVNFKKQEVGLTYKCYKMIISNNGNRPVINLNIIIEPNIKILLSELFTDEFDEILDQRFIAPKSKIENSINIHSDRKAPDNINIKLNYQNTSGKTYHEDYNIPFDSNMDDINN